MKSPLRERLFLSTLVFVLAAVLVILAMMQYHWSQEVSQAQTARLKSDLDISMMSWREDLYRELAGVSLTMQVDPATPLYDKLTQYSHQYDAWTRTTQHPNLITHILLWENAGSRQQQLLEFNKTNGQFERVAWPNDFGQVHDWLQQASTLMVNSPKLRAAFDDLHKRPGVIGFPPHMGFRPEAPAMLDAAALVMVRPQFARDPARDRNAAGLHRQVDWVIVQFDRKVLKEHILPELVDRHFAGAQGLEFNVAVITGAPERPETIYSSDPGFGGGDAKIPPDGAMPVFGPAFGPPFGGQHHNMAIVVGPGPHPRQGRVFRQHIETGFSEHLRIETVPYAAAGSEWQLVVRHRKGSLDAAVADMRHRNLAIGFGVLVVLGAAMGMIIIASQRARTLARLQMDFVAAVSHELRTPLAVISSAADNITDGVVGSKQQLSQYGLMIKDQAKQLTSLVEQILLFVSTRNARHHFNLQPLQVAEVVDAALHATAGLIGSAGVTVEKDIQPNLPPVMGDLPALSHCLQNLITNAVKYGGEARWMRVSACAAGPEVQITVEDKGMGIAISELHRIFEPFYRSASVTAAQIHGTGLGLPLARNIAQAMGGRFTVTSEPGKGSSFTLHLPSTAEGQAQASVKAGAVANPRFS